MIRTIKKYIPGFLRTFIKFIIRPFYFGSGRYCPVCGNTSRKFAEFGIDKRPDAKCGHCGALERHRLVWKYFHEKTGIFGGGVEDMLHIAPEKIFTRKLSRAVGKGYISADLFDKTAMVKMDITKIGYPDGSFDIIYCSHVLEHVPDDWKAMSEFFRTLKNEGQAVIMVPETEGVTIEDPSITDPRERLRLFGQEDHVRMYGTDFPQRLRECGFRVEIFSAESFLNEKEIELLGLKYSRDKIYICTK